MSTIHYDAVVVGARVAGAATSMLLARRGMRVLMLDRARYGSDTLSTHALMRPAVLQLSRWGLLDRVIASGAPPIRRAVFHYPDERLALDIEPLYAPRRTVLDPILIDAAVASGTDVIFGVSLDDLRRDSTGRVVGVIADGIPINADIVIGADGIRSTVALLAGAEVTRQSDAAGACVLTYYRGIEAEGYEWIYGDGVAAGLIPTNDGESCAFVAGPAVRFRREVQPDLERGFAKIFEEASPAVAPRVLAGERTARFRGFAGVRGYYRKPFGPGWALVGDAGYFRDPITTHGITDAFRDAELLARAIDGTSTFAEYEAIRDDVTRDLFHLTERIASYDWSQPELRQHLRAISTAMKPETRLILGFDTTKEAVA
jgi:flavin-dependent dehydrogenase